MTIELQTKFQEYHRTNPSIYIAFEKFARVAAKFRSHYGAKSIMERLRWETMLAGDDVFKINNNYASYYGRLFEEHNPQHEGFFRKRRV